MPFQLTEIPPDWAKSDYDCPICKEKLFFRPHNNKIGMWCLHIKNCSIGANEGAYGKNQKEAFENLKQKLLGRN